jgi:hypothetical protein
MEITPERACSQAWLYTLLWSSRTQGHQSGAHSYSSPQPLMFNGLCELYEEAGAFDREEQHKKLHPGMYTYTCDDLIRPGIYE